MKKLLAVLGLAVVHSALAQNCPDKNLM